MTENYASYIVSVFPSEKEPKGNTSGTLDFFQKNAILPHRRSETQYTMPPNKSEEFI